MFSSVCSIRSAQCAALIALAAVVGLSRFEPTSQPEPDTAGASSVTRSVPRHSSFSHPLASRAFGLLAHAIGLYREVFVRPTFISSPLADEPTANLDSVTGGQILALMKELNHQEGVTFLFSTHDHRVMELANRIIQVQDGRIVDDGGVGQNPTPAAAPTTSAAAASAVH